MATSYHASGDGAGVTAGSSSPDRSKSGVAHRTGTSDRFSSDVRAISDNLLLLSNQIPELSDSLATSSPRTIHAKLNETRQFANETHRLLKRLNHTDYTSEIDLHSKRATYRELSSQYRSTLRALDQAAQRALRNNARHRRRSSEAAGSSSDAAEDYSTTLLEDAMSTDGASSSVTISVDGNRSNSWSSRGHNSKPSKTATRSSHSRKHQPGRQDTSDEAPRLRGPNDFGDYGHSAEPSALLDYRLHSREATLSHGAPSLGGSSATGSGPLARTVPMSSSNGAGGPGSGRDMPVVSRVSTMSVSQPDQRHLGHKFQARTLTSSESSRGRSGTGELAHFDGGYYGSADSVTSNRRFLVGSYDRPAFELEQQQPAAWPPAGLTGIPPLYNNNNNTTNNNFYTAAPGPPGEPIMSSRFPAMSAVELVSGLHQDRSTAQSSLYVPPTPMPSAVAAPAPSTLSSYQQFEPQRAVPVYRGTGEPVKQDFMRVQLIPSQDINRQLFMDSSQNLLRIRNDVEGVRELYEGMSRYVAKEADELDNIENSLDNTFQMSGRALTDLHATRNMQRTRNRLVLAGATLSAIAVLVFLLSIKSYV